MGLGMTGPKGKTRKAHADTLFHSSCVGAPFFALCLLKRPSFRPDLLSESEAMEGGIYFSFSERPSGSEDSEGARPNVLFGTG